MCCGHVIVVGSSRVVAVVYRLQRMQSDCRDWRGLLSVYGYLSV